MEIEELVLTFAGLLLFFDLVQLSRQKPHDENKLEHGFYAATLASGLIVISYFMFVQAFVRDDFSLREVYSYSSSSLPAASKVFASWGGAGGSLLLLTVMTGIAYFAYRFRTNQKKSSLNISASVVLNVILIFFVLLTLMKNPFQRLSPTPVDGNGLNPQLQSIWMVVHPPIVFSGYVFVLLAFSLTLASMKTDEKGDAKLLKLSLQSAWTLLTLGIALGGVWAYEVLGWGGYWSWDPVETASLLPWLALTAYFHLSPLVKNNKGLAKESMVLLAFASLIFLSALTRGGLLSSVHAYALSPAGPFLLLFGLGMAIYFFYLKRKTGKPLFSLEVERGSLYSFSFLIGFFALLFIFLVCFFGVAFPIIQRIYTASPLTPSEGYYYSWNFPFALAFVAALIGCSIYEKANFKKFTALIVGALVAGVVLILVQWPTPIWLANLGIPLLIVGLGAASYRLVQALPREKRSFKQFGRSLIHLGIIIILLGVFISSTTKQTSEILDAKPNTNVETLGLRIELHNLTVYLGGGQIQYGDYLFPEQSALKLDVAIAQGESTYNCALWIRDYAVYGIVSNPLIISTLRGDIYINLLPTESTLSSLVQALMGNEVQPEDFVITVEIIPMVYLIWAGAVLLTIGMAIPLIVNTARSQKHEDAEIQVEEG